MLVSIKGEAFAITSKGFFNVKNPGELIPQGYLAKYMKRTLLLIITKPKTCHRYRLGASRSFTFIASVYAML
jgi:hypothetical protein